MAPSTWSPHPMSCSRRGSAARSWLPTANGWASNLPRRDTLPSPQAPAQGRASDLDLSGPVELVVLSVKERAARCRLPGSDRVITLRASRLWDVVPGEIVVVKPRKQWSYAGHPYLSGEIESTRLDVAALGLVPLRLEDRGIWNPESITGARRTNRSRSGPSRSSPAARDRSSRWSRSFRAADPEDIDSDPIIEANELKDAGDARRRTDPDGALRGRPPLPGRPRPSRQLRLRHRPKDAIRHYEVGVRIGELSLGPDFDGLLPWGYIDNRPFLRCMHGFGLCLWRLGRSRRPSASSTGCSGSTPPTTRECAS